MLGAEAAGVAEGQRGRRVGAVGALLDRRAAALPGGAGRGVLPPAEAPAEEAVDVGERRPRTEPAKAPLLLVRRQARRGRARLGGACPRRAPRPVLPRGEHLPRAPGAGEVPDGLAPPGRQDGAAPLAEPVVRVPPAAPVAAPGPTRGGEGKRPGRERARPDLGRVAQARTAREGQGAVRAVPVARLAAARGRPPAHVGRLLVRPGQRGLGHPQAPTPPRLAARRPPLGKVAGTPLRELGLGVAGGRAALGALGAVPA